MLYRSITTGGLLFLLTARLAVAEPAEPVQFNRDVRPILSNNCYACHGPDKGTREADLRLDERASAIDAHERTPAIVPGKPDASELVRRITSSDDSERMPPADSEKHLTPEQIETLRRWIAEGANWQPHWSFLPPARPPVPQPSNPHSEIRNPIDAFVIDRLNREGLQLATEADRRILIRRLSFDLTGLPPSPDEVDAFVSSASPDVYEQRVDRLLASPHYGERMAIFWLDLVRFADTVGYHGDQETSISPYRDYVINSFNENLPFDQFTTEQLAGDLLPEATIWQKVASGFNRLNMTTEEGGAQAGEYLAKYAADRVRAVSTVWMGATMGCCECHDHKFDPYATKDFYRFAACFADLDEQGVYGGRGDRPPVVLIGRDDGLADFKRLGEELYNAEQLAKPLESDPAKSAELSELKQRIEKLLSDRAAVEKQIRPSLVSTSVTPRVMRVLPRGNWMDDAGEIVEPGVPHFMRQPDVGGRRFTRLDLAKWLTTPDHPQTARVFVNRLWRLFYGVGISRVLDDVGAQGEWPTHPELLDYLAAELVESGWDVKHLVKLLVTSSTYRQSSVASDALRERDPLNRLFARQSAWRIDAEMVRDNALAVSDLLVKKIGGPSVRPYQPEGYYAFLNFPPRTYKHDQGENQYRRGVYMHWQRTFLHPQLLAFDAPTREECTAQRPISNTPKAALTLLNDPTFVEAARVLAEHIVRHGGHYTNDRMTWAFRKALARKPTPQEQEVISRLVSRHTEHYTHQPAAAEALVRTGQHPSPTDLPISEVAAWTSVARVLLNTGESITRE